MEVSARRSTTLHGRLLCVGGFYGRPSTDGRRQSRSAVSAALLVRLQASAALKQPGTDYQRLFDHQN